MSEYAFSVAEAARKIGISHSTAKTLVRDGSLRSFRVGRRRLITPEAIRDFIAIREGAR